MILFSNYFLFPLIKLFLLKVLGKIKILKHTHKGEKSTKCSFYHKKLGTVL